MSVESDLCAALLPFSDAVVWGSFNDATGFPRITLKRISNTTAYSLKGRSGIETARVQVDVYSTDADEVLELGPAISKALTDLRGGSIIRVKEISRRDGPSGTGDDVIRLQMLDFMVRYRA